MEAPPYTAALMSSHSALFKIGVAHVPSVTTSCVFVGARVGDAVGSPVGVAVGDEEGDPVGSVVGLPVGSLVGLSLIHI